MSENEVAEENVYRLSDESVMMIMQVLQYGMLLGIDVSDLFRTMLFHPAETGMLEPSEQTVENFAREIDEMVKAIPDLIAAAEVTAEE